MKRVADLLGGGGIGTRFCERKHAIDGVPELGEGLIEIEKLVVGGSGLGESGFVFNGVLQVGADAFELRDPGENWIGLGGVLHVAHSEAERVEVVLNAEELERVTAVAVNEVALHFVDYGELEGDVGGISKDGEDGDDEAEVEAACGSVLRGRRVLHRGKDITRGRGRERQGRILGGEFGIGGWSDGAGKGGLGDGV